MTEFDFFLIIGAGTLLLLLACRAIDRNVGKDNWERQLDQSRKQGP